MSSAMHVHRCQFGELKALCTFWSTWRTGARPGDVSPDELHRLHHYTFENPFSNGEGTSWLVWEQDCPIAHLRDSPCPAYYLGERVESGWWQGFYARPDSCGVPRGDAAALVALKLSAQRHGHAVLGTPGVESGVFKLYRRMNWDYWGTVPFFYFVVDGIKVLRNLAVFKRSRLLAVASNAASHIYLPAKLLALRHWRLRSSVSHCDVVAWQFFPSEANVLWETVRGLYPLIFERSTQYLNWRYCDLCYERLGVFQENRLLGWVVCKTTQMRDNKFFGNMRVGTVVDFLVDPEKSSDADTILSLALNRLVANGADLIVTNLCHRRFVDAACRVGFAEGPSNHHFLTKNLHKVQLSACHLTRGDSDGDGHL